MKEFCLPSLGADMDEGTVVEWLVSVGDQVSRGDIVALVETEKGVIEVEVWEDATIAELAVPEGTKVAVGAVIARFGSAGEQRAEPEAAPDKELAAAVAAGRSEEIQEEPLVAAGAGAGPVLTPPIRHLAHQLDVDLEAVIGTGPAGSVTRDDVRRSALVAVPPRSRERPRVSPYAKKVAAEHGIDIGSVADRIGDRPVRAADLEPRPAPAAEQAEAPAAPAPAPSVTEKPVPDERKKRADQAAAMRHAIAQVMAKSKREIPHYYLATTIDMNRALGWLAEYNVERPVTERVLPAVLLLKASALAIGEVPEMNGFFVDGEYRPSPAVHLGVAVSLRRGGLIAPAIHNAEEMTVDELMAALRDLVARTRNGRLRGSEMSDPTITITNLGDRGVETVFPVIYAPQVAIVGFGKVVEQPVAHDGMIAVRPTVHATLAADHRVSDGHRGGLYLAAVERWLQKPEEL